jgi:hypothetical protein
MVTASRRHDGDHRSLTAVRGRLHFLLGMKLLRAHHVFAALVATVTALPAASAFAQESTAGTNSNSDVVPTLVWMALGVAGFGVALTMCYFLKRRLGGFPKNPSWVAPISIRPSSDFPADTDAHGAAAHDEHTPGAPSHVPAGH